VATENKKKCAHLPCVCVPQAETSIAASSVKTLGVRRLRLLVTAGILLALAETTKVIPSETSVTQQFPV
jgi:hypothetical protein